MAEAADLPVIRQISSRLVYENAWLSVREDGIERPDGSHGIYGVIDRPDFAVVIAAERGGFHLVDQYRYPLLGRYWEFPQGCFPGRRDGDALELAHRELAEETGLRAGSMVPLGRLAAWHGASGQMCTVFLATELVQGEPEREHEEQDMRHRWCSRAEFEALIRSGGIRDNTTVSSYMLLRLHEEEGGGSRCLE
ncbi:MAG TPA: NUDIX hydrolase [Amycolatopsis sp.]|uniref:NUDIX hydrolase n=1 Tax=Amycolatopsis sp. TaxID=37632 RepID=UPI002F409BFF